MNPRLVIIAAALVALTGCAPAKEAGPTPKSSTPSATTKPDALDIHGLKVGDAPKIGWSKRTLFKGDADKDVLPPKLDQFVETKQLLVMRDVDGNVFAYAADGPTGTTPIGKATGELAVNDERNLVAWIAPDGAPTVLQEGEAKPAVLPKPDGVTGGDAVAVLGHDCFNGPETVEGAGCSVYLRAETVGPPARSFVASNHGFVETINGGGAAGMSLQDADTTGTVGWTEVREDHGATCSTYTGHETLDADVVNTWKTCDFLPLSFSPDGKHILATQPEGFEGAGAGQIAILDRHTGKEIAAIRNNATSQTFIQAMVWEDDRHVLATVNQKLDSAIVRFGLDGTMELATKPVRSKEEPDNPFRLAVQP